MVMTDIDRREFLRRSLLAGVGVTLASGLTSTLMSTTARASTGSCLTGAHALPRGTEVTQINSTLALEGEIGRQLDAIRRYSYWGGYVPDRTHLWAAQGGRIPYISLHAYSMGKKAIIPWAEIARGDHDAYLLQVGQKLAAFGYPTYFNFHHEPENEPECGTPADFQAAFARVRSVIDSAGATNLMWVCTLMGGTYRGRHGGADSWVPDPSTYTFVGTDGYNRFPIVPHPGWMSFSDVFISAQQKAVSLGKKLFIGEFGTIEQTAGGYPGDPQAKAIWFQDAASTVTSWGNVEAAIYSHTVANFSGYKMPYWIDTSASSLASFSSMASLPPFTV
jgi:hypothetical protein